jgi:hypothetical protein
LVGLRLLAEVALAENELGGDGVAALSVVLASCGELKRLDLSRNNVGETGALALVFFFGCFLLFFFFAWEMPPASPDNVGETGALALVSLALVCVCVCERERERERERESESES